MPVRPKKKPLNSPQKKSKGRPPLWQPHFAAIAAEMAASGATDREIAEQFKVSVRTLHFWKKDHPDLLDALKVGKHPADERVVQSLYHRAVGYTFESEKIFHYQGKILRAKTIEHVPPDTTAMIFWLKNRRPAEFRDRQEQVKFDVHMSLAELVNMSYSPSLPEPAVIEHDPEEK